MKVQILILSLILTCKIGLSQNYNSLKGKTWICTKVTSKMNLDKSNYLNQTLSLLSNGNFKFVKEYKAVSLKNEINGTYHISTVGQFTFPTSKLTTTMNGKTTTADCIYNEKGENFNTCMLPCKINIINKNSFTVTYKGSKDSEIQEDIILTYTLK